jgi:hypothetical protein
MEGTITQLGLKNYLTDPKRPKVSFFSHGYKNYGNYAKDTRKLNFLATADFGKQVSFRFDQDGRYGDLITNLTLQMELPTLPNTTAGTEVVYTNGVGNAIVKELTLKIGGNVVETHSAEWMDVWSTLSIPESKKAIYNSMIKKSDNIHTFYAHQVRNNPNWADEALKSLGDQVYISVDADGFDPSIVPAVGTAEPNGLLWNETVNFLRRVFAEKQVVGFDVVEIAPVKGNILTEYTMAKLIYKMIGYHTIGK